MGARKESLLGPLSHGERMLLWRKRNRFTQAEVAKKLRCCQQDYARIEADNPDWKLPRGFDHMVSIRAPRDAAESILILRRRLTLDMPTMATMTGFSRQTLAHILTGSGCKATTNTVLAILMQAYKEKHHGRQGK